MNDNVNHPRHYESQSISLEPIDFCERLPFCEGNALKYCFRAGHKQGASELQDLKKAYWYLERNQRSPGAVRIEEDNEDDFYKLASCLQFSKSEILRISYQFSSDYFTFWGYLKDNVRHRIVQLEREQNEIQNKG